MINVSVDIDSVAHYLALYGESIDAPDAAALTAQTYEDGVGRFLDLFAELGVAATFFAVGQDLDVPAAARLLRRAAPAGPALANPPRSPPDHRIHRPPARAPPPPRGPPPPPGGPGATRSPTTPGPIPTT